MAEEKHTVKAQALQPAARGGQPQKPARPVAQRKSAQASRGFIPSLSRGFHDYFQSLKYEWLKMTFPTRKEWVQSTVVVFLFTLVLMAIISLYDMLMSLIFSKWILPPTG
jgi:preprotein translocase SecE subunit